MIRSLYTVAMLFLLVGSFTSTLPAQASLSHNAVVSDNPADTTPHIVLDGGSQKIMAFEKVGDTIYAGGVFAEVMDPLMTTTYYRQNFFAFDSKTGVISPLNLSFNGIVTGIEAYEDQNGKALFISGAFNQVNEITCHGIAKYNIDNDQIDHLTFVPGDMGTVSDIKLANGALIAAGNFEGHLIAMDPTTGADLGTIDITVTGNVAIPEEQTRVRRIAISPDGTRLVATGNFDTVGDANGDKPRKRAFMLNLESTPATLSDWYAPRFDVPCGASSRQVSAQGVDFSPVDPDKPDQPSYFVIVTTGGPTGIINGLCDAAARFETANESSSVEPTWINWTGGDSLWSVAVTGAAVYVGGHQRWLDNPSGWDSAGGGEFYSPGIGAIDPETGEAIRDWNPTILPELTDGTRALLATPDGLWVGSDADRFGGEDHAGIGFFPFDLNPTEPDTIRPITSIDSGPSGPVSDTSATFSFSSSEDGTFQCRLDGAAFTPCTSPVSYENLTVVDPAGPSTILEAHFDVDEDGFVYIDNAFRGASESAYADGVRIASGGFSGGALQVTLGNVDDIEILDMSGGWQRSFNLSAPTEVGLSFRYNLSQTPDYENDEISQILVSVDGNLHGTPPNDYVAQIVGNGNGGDPETTGWQLFQINLGTLAAGNHTLTIGGYNNKKTYSDENTDVLIDDVLVSGSGGSHIFQVVAVDESYNMDASPAKQSWTVVPLGSELIGNPGFEVDTSGWTGEGSSNELNLVAGGHSGDGAVEVCTNAGGNFGLSDSPNWVSYTEDRSYTASIWARSDSPGLELTLRVREYAGGVRQGTVTELLALTPSWQQVTANYTPAPGSTLDFEAYINGAPAGVCFQADDASITATPINDPPTAVDDSASTGEDTAVIIDVAANDTDPDGNLNPASVNTSCGTCADPANGTLVNHSDGTVSYTPDPGFTGSDSFVYEICDTGLLCDTATADITVRKNGDCDGDCDVDGNDLALLISEYGCISGCTYDLTGDGHVDENDLAELALHYGELCP